MSSQAQSQSQQSSSSSIRRASEDPRFRSFLSHHFDAQAHVTGVIQEGRSEEVFTELSTCIEEVDEEIKNYISLHKHDLMAGMQDVAILSKRYQTLQATSNRLRLSVDKMKRETFDSYSLVRSRTQELEHIHNTSVLLRQLRQFTHAKAQLDHYSSAASNAMSGGELDLRQFAAVAKTVQELEQLMQSSQLISLQIVAGQVEQIRTFGAQLRDLAREKLLAALRDQDQATVADCLQVFFNLHSLPQVVLMAIDATVKDTIELSSAALNFDLITEGSSAGQGRSVTSSKLKNKTGSNSVGSENLLSNASQLRVAMREMCHSWAGMVQEQALKVHVLQRVIAKKEDPTTHEKFITVLMKESASSPSFLHGEHQTMFSGNGRRKGSQQLCLLEIYWKRLAVSLQDVTSSKLKVYPVAAPRIYPNLRRAAVEVYAALKVLSVGDFSERDTIYGDGGLFSELYEFGESTMDDFGDSKSQAIEDGSHNARFRRPIGIFGSVCATATALSSSGLVITPSTFGSVCAKKAMVNERVSATVLSPRSSDGSPRARSISSANESQLSTTEVGILPSLTPLRDRYLLSALSRMTAPVLQMFPEVEGYTAAVPSKRDLQALLKTVQEEVVHVVLEGDRSLIQLIAKEALKAVQLLLTKVEGMVSTGLESTRIQLTKDDRYIKTNQQEHNGQLLQLLSQLTDFIHKLPSQIIKATKDSPSFALSRLLYDGKGGDHGDVMDEEDSGETVLREEMRYFVTESIRCAKELAGKQLLHPLVESLSSHFRHLMLGLLKEGVAGGTNASTSKTLSNLSTKFPEAVTTFLQISSSTSSTLNQAVLPFAVAIQELCSRIIMTYVSIAALRRPVTEQSRLMTAAEISSIDMMVTGMLSPGQDKNNIVLAELHSFRRLLFEPIEQNPSNVGDTGEKKTSVMLGTAVECTPQPSKVLALPYLKSLRPSTILAYLLSCGPKQLPSMSDSSSFDMSNEANSNKKTPSLDAQILSSETSAAYVKMLTQPSTMPHSSSDQSLTAKLSSSSNTIRGDKGADDGAELKYLGTTVKHAFVHSLLRSWKHISDSEKKSIDMARQCLDVFVQRIAVCDDDKKTTLTVWYESLLSICNSFNE